MSEKRPDALDELERVDRAIGDRLEEFRQARPGPAPAEGGSSPQLVIDAARHGTVGKNLIEQLALREAALTAVTDAFAGDASVADLVDRLEHAGRERRAKLDRLEEIARGMNGMYLNSNDDFDGEVDQMASIIEREVPEQLGEIIPALRDRLGVRDAALPSAASVKKHAPLHPSPERRWYQRFGPLVRLHALYDHYRGFPEGGSVPSSDVEQESDYTKSRRG